MLLYHQPNTSTTATEVSLMLALSVTTIWLQFLTIGKVLMGMYHSWIFVHSNVLLELLALLPSLLVWLLSSTTGVSSMERPLSVSSIKWSIPLMLLIPQLSLISLEETTSALSNAAVITVTWPLKAGILYVFSAVVCLLCNFWHCLVDRIRNTQLPFPP